MCDRRFALSAGYLSVQMRQACEMKIDDEVALSKIAKKKCYKLTLKRIPKTDIEDGQLGWWLLTHGIYRVKNLK